MKKHDFSVSVCGDNELCQPGLNNHNTHPRQGTSSRLDGVTFKMLADEALCRHRLSYNLRECDTYVLPNPGYYHWRKGGEKHINDPDNIASLQVSGGRG